MKEKITGWIFILSTIIICLTGCSNIPHNLVEKSPEISIRPTQLVASTPDMVVQPTINSSSNALISPPIPNTPTSSQEISTITPAQVDKLSTQEVIDVVIVFSQDDECKGTLIYEGWVEGGTVQPELFVLLGISIYTLTHKQIDCIHRTDKFGMETYPRLPTPG